MLGQSFELGKEYLRARFSFLFTPANEEQCEKWKLSTWSKRTQRSYVLKHGSQADKQHLPAPTARNKKHNEKRSFTVLHTKPRKTKKQC